MIAVSLIDRSVGRGATGLKLVHPRPAQYTHTPTRQGNTQGGASHICVRDLYREEELRLRAGKEARREGGSAAAATEDAAWAGVRSQDRQAWYCCNDSTVSSISAGALGLRYGASSDVQPYQRSADGEVRRVVGWRLFCASVA